MTAQKDSGSRDVIPRWRSVRRTIEAGEFQVLQRKRVLDSRHQAHIHAAQSRWNSQPSEISAAELVGSKLVTDESVDVSGAAQYLKDKGSNPLVRRIASKALAEPQDGTRAHERRGSSVSSDQFFYERIRKDKLRLRRDPRNAIAWVDIARRYTAIGQFPQAERAITLAIALAPTSRYIHRVASRFYVHVGSPDVAYRLLSKWERTKEDPWLMAALLSVASVGDLPIRSLKPARRIIDNSDFRPIETSELVSEVATIELRDGNERRARPLFRRSLTTPTDNSLAQVEWASSQITQLSVSYEGLDVPFAAEALARSAAERGDWDEAYEQALVWLDDQPFDTDAAVFGSYIAAVAFENWEGATTIARAGLTARPGDPLLSNNLAYALAEDGFITEAIDVLSSVNVSLASTEDQIALTATQGLLNFRAGNASAGSKDYRRAIEVARRHGYSELEAMASSMFLREALSKHEWQDLTDLIVALQKFQETLSDQAVLLCIRRTESLLSERNDATSRPDTQEKPN